VNEGVLAGLERLTEGCTQEEAMGVARIAMRPVSIPNSGEVNAILAAIRRDEELSNYSQALVEAMTGTQESVQPNTLISTTCLEDDYIQKELSDRVTNVIYFWLPPKDSYIMHRLFFVGTSEVELAEELEVTQQYISKEKLRILQTLVKYLLQEEHSQEFT